MKTIYLRALELDDLERTHKWHNDPELFRVACEPFHFTGYETEKEWLNHKVVYSEKDVNLAICLTNNSQHIGIISIENIEYVARQGELKILIGEPSAISREEVVTTIDNMTRYAMEDLGLNKLFTYVLDEDNEKIEILESCGWLAEVKLREHFFRNRRYNDVIIMGICAADLLVNIEQ